jgi:hypothetical protein
MQLIALAHSFFVPESLEKSNQTNQKRLQHRPKPLISMVGPTGFEPATPRPPV